MEAIGIFLPLIVVWVVHSLLSPISRTLAATVGEKPEYEKGDEITATRTPEGFDTGEAYGYGR